MKKKPIDNEGAARLRELFPGKGGPGKIAALFEENPPDISVANRWRSGDRAPSAPYRYVFEKKLHIDWRDWDRAAKKRGRAA